MGTIDVIKEMKELDSNPDYIKSKSRQYHNVKTSTPYVFITYTHAFTGLKHKTFIL